MANTVGNTKRASRIRSIAMRYARNIKNTDSYKKAFQQGAYNGGKRLTDAEFDSIYDRMNNRQYARSTYMANSNS